jgi:hypothetical protein
VGTDRLAISTMNHGCNISLGVIILCVGTRDNMEIPDSTFGTLIAPKNIRRSCQSEDPGKLTGTLCLA